MTQAEDWRVVEATFLDPNRMCRPALLPAWGYLKTDEASNSWLDVHLPMRNGQRWGGKVTMLCGRVASATKGAYYDDEIVTCPMCLDAQG